MVAEELNKSWEPACMTAECNWDGERSTEAWKILRNLRRNGNGIQG